MQFYIAPLGFLLPYRDGGERQFSHLSKRGPPWENQKTFGISTGRAKLGACRSCVPLPASTAFHGHSSLQPLNPNWRWSLQLFSSPMTTSRSAENTHPSSQDGVGQGIYHRGVRWDNGVLVTFLKYAFIVQRNILECLQKQGERPCRP